jgi:antitoxin VapB
MSELDEKTERLQRMLLQEGLGGVLLSAQHNFAWLTCGGNNGVDLSRENGAALLLVRADGRRFVLASNSEMPRMLAEEVSENDFEPLEVSWQDEKAATNYVLEKVKTLLQNGDLATDIALEPMTRAIENKIAHCRYYLTGTELDRYRTLGSDAGRAIVAVIEKLTPGATEIEIAETIRHEFGLRGMTSVVTLVAADERISNYRHPVPTGNRWRKTLLLVTCAKRGGLIVSLSRMICAGDASDDLKRRTASAAYVNACLLDATRTGATGADLYQTAAAAYAGQGFADEINFHHQGGATGYKTREWVAHPKSTETVLASQAFAWNPSITGTKIEETCIVNDDDVEMITPSPDFPTISTKVNGREYISPGILSI